MKNIFALLVVFAAAAYPAGTKDQLSTEQASAYRHFMQSLTKMNIRFVSRRTFSFDLSSVPNKAPCLRGLQFEHANHRKERTHALTAAELPNPSMRLVDEPGEAAILQQMDSRKSSGQSEQASDPGVLALSEVIFDETHHFAILKYALLCGVHCNSSAILVLEKTELGWTGTSRRPCSFGPLNQPDPRSQR
jgi:hypothetical protein